MTVLRVENISKSFGAIEVIRATSFSADAGETLAFMSPSGSGKSTMLSMVGLLLKPDTGSITVDIKDDACKDNTRNNNVLSLDDAALSALRRRMFGFVFQSTQLIGSLRALENVMAPANFAGKLPFNAKEKALELLERFGLSDRIYHYPYQLSVGQKRRVALARALLLQPTVIIADEPTNDLDAQSATTVADALFDYAKEDHILLFATHDETLSKRASRILTMHDKAFVERLP